LILNVTYLTLLSFPCSHHVIPQISGVAILEYIYEGTDAGGFIAVINDSS